MNHIEPFWDDEYKHLKYTKIPFSNKYDVSKWREKGYNQDKKYFTGQMCSHKEKQPSWNDIFVKWTEKEYNLKDIGCCYYRMVTNEIIPVHGDNYKLYRDGELVMQFSSETSQHLDYQSIEGVSHEYCIYSNNNKVDQNYILYTPRD